MEEQEHERAPEAPMSECVANPPPSFPLSAAVDHAQPFRAVELISGYRVALKMQQQHY